MKVITGKLISSGLINFSYTEVALTAKMLKIIYKEQFVIDIGTHFGYESLLAAKLVGPS
jgi:hypothetical protein